MKNLKEKLTVNQKNATKREKKVFRKYFEDSFIRTQFFNLLFPSRSLDNKRIFAFEGEGSLKYVSLNALRKLLNSPTILTFNVFTREDSSKRLLNLLEPLPPSEKVKYLRLIFILKNSPHEKIRSFASDLLKDINDDVVFLYKNTSHFSRFFERMLYNSFDIGGREIEMIKYLNPEHKFLNAFLWIHSDTTVQNTASQFFRARTGKSPSDFSSHFSKEEKDYIKSYLFRALKSDMHLIRQYAVDKILELSPELSYRLTDFAFDRTLFTTLLTALENLSSKKSGKAELLKQREKIKRKINKVLRSEFINELGIYSILRLTKIYELKELAPIAYIFSNYNPPNDIVNELDRLGKFNIASLSKNIISHFKMKSIDSEELKSDKRIIKKITNFMRKTVTRSKKTILHTYLNTIKKLGIKEAKDILYTISKDKDTFLFLRSTEIWEEFYDLDFPDIGINNSSFFKNLRSILFREVPPNQQLPQCTEDHYKSELYLHLIELTSSFEYLTDLIKFARMSKYNLPIKNYLLPEQARNTLKNMLKVKRNLSKQDLDFLKKFVERYWISEEKFILNLVLESIELILKNEKKLNPDFLYYLTILRNYPEHPDEQEKNIVSRAEELFSHYLYLEKDFSYNVIHDKLKSFIEDYQNSTITKKKIIINVIKKFGFVEYLPLLYMFSREEDLQLSALAYSALSNFELKALYSPINPDRAILNKWNKYFDKLLSNNQDLSGIKILLRNIYKVEYFYPLIYLIQHKTGKTDPISIPKLKLSEFLRVSKFVLLSRNFSFREKKDMIPWLLRHLKYKSSD